MDQQHPSVDIIGSRSRALVGRHIALGITGSVAAVRSADIARELMRHGAEVTAVMTRDAVALIHPNLMEWATGRPVVTELTGGIEHVALAGNVPGRVDLVLIAPCTANTIGKIAAGIDDTTVTTLATTALGQGVPLVLVPAMHEPMYDHPLVRQNIARLQEIDVDVMMPRLEEGKAKIPETEEIRRQVELHLGGGSPNSLRGFRVTVTAGRTVEYLDPVRVITNNSSGKMGVAVAESLRRRGADVTLICAKMSVSPPPGLRRVSVETAEEMAGAVREALTEGYGDAFFGVAAVGDWKPVEAAGEKIPTAGNERITLELEPTPKIIDTVRSQSPESCVVAFRALHGPSREELVRDARERLARAGAQFIAVNDVAPEDAGFESDTNRLLVIDDRGDETEIPGDHKSRVADRLVTLVGERLRGAGKGFASE